MLLRNRIAGSWIWAILALFIGCSPGEGTPGVDLRPSAEDFFNGVFGCDPALIDATASEDVVVSYPIFESLFGTPAMRGGEAVRGFAAGFCRRWSDPVITVHEALQDGNRVVLVWEFSAIPVVSDSGAASPRGEAESWGGISFFRFDEAGRVIEEVGEESTPGPTARLRR